MPSANPPKNRNQILRAELRRTRAALTAAAQQTAARRLCNRLVSADTFADTIKMAFYLPFDGEISPLPALDKFVDQGRLAFLPVVQADGTLVFRRYRPGVTRLAPNRFGIGEPVSEASEPGSKQGPPDQVDIDLTAADLDVIFLPLVGFDRNGNRLGMGGGYYDRTLETLSSAPSRPLFVGLAHQCQEVELVPDPWDIPVDFIATDDIFIRCQIPRT